MKKIILFFLVIFIFLIIGFIGNKAFAKTYDVDYRDWPFYDDVPAFLFKISEGWKYPPKTIETGKNITVEGVVGDDCYTKGYISVYIAWGDRKYDKPPEGGDWDIDADARERLKCDGFTALTQKSEFTLLPPVAHLKFSFSHWYSLSGEYSIRLYLYDAANRRVIHDMGSINVTGDPVGGPIGAITIGPLNLPNPFGPDVQNFGDLIDKLISFVFTLALILFPILLIVAGIMFLTAGGDPAKVQQARKLLIYAVVGFAIIALARLFVELIQQVFGVKEGG